MRSVKCVVVGDGAVGELGEGEEFFPTQVTAKLTVSSNSFRQDLPTDVLQPRHV